MRTGSASFLFISLLLPVIAHARPFTLASEDRILPPSLELERRVEPWCPADCVIAGFAALHPKIVILEGFPTAMGENPPPLVDEARHYGAANAPDFDRGEAMYAALLALRKDIPFIGGEPTRDEENQALKAHGFSDADMGFSALLGWYSQSLRSGDIPDTSVESLAKIYPKLAENIRASTDLGGWNLDAPSLETFQQRYREDYGLDIVGDSQFPSRIDIGDTTRQGQQGRVAMMTRDRHLLGLIEQQLTDRHLVLVIYGGSHWATLSLAFQERLGNPKVTPFFK